MRPNIKISVAIIAVTIALAAVRFAHTTPDSTHYIALGNFFQGELAKESLRTPYAYRILVSFLSAYLPGGDIAYNMALISLVSTVGAYFVFYFYLVALFQNKNDVLFGTMLVVVSFPTFNYASGVLTDATGFLFFVLATYFLLRKNFLGFALAASFGVLTREANLAITLAFILYLLVNRFLQIDKKISLLYLVYALPSIAIYALIRFYFADLPSYFWSLSLDRLVSNLTRPVSWATSMLTLLPFLALILIGWPQRKKVQAEILAYTSHQKTVLLTVTAVCLALAGYSILSAFMSGRFFWPLYITLVPLAVLFGKQTNLYQKWVVPICDYLTAVPSSG